MRLFKVLKAENAEGQVLSYEARPIKMDTPEQAMVFVHEKDEAATREFELAKLVAQTIGVEELEKKSFREHIESEVLTRLAEVQERAYKEAYDLGLEDGHKKAYTDTSAQIQERLSSLAALLGELSELKTQMFTQNEGSIMRVLFSCAKAIALKEITSDKGSIREVLKAAIENAQTDEKVVVRINPTDFEFVEKLKADPNPQFDKLRTIKLEPDPAVLAGGCIIETNYGVIDASIEERVQKLWKTLEGKIPNSTTDKTDT